jgi:hypothetical protein
MKIILTRQVYDHKKLTQLFLFLTHFLYLESKIHGTKLVKALHIEL